MRRAAVIAAVALGAFAGQARAASLETIEVPSRHVDPKAIQFNGPPPGAQAVPPGLRANVLLPDGYRANGKDRWPVLFLLHGHGDTFAHWSAPERGNVAEIAKGFPGIIVMPEGARGWYANWFNGGARAAPAWERYYLEELVPAIERRYRIRPERRYHAIAGLSMGGGGALLYAALAPGYFGSAASFSGAISTQRLEWPNAFDTQGERHQDVYGDPNAQRFYWTGHNPVALAANAQHTRFFVSVGDGTPVRGEAGNSLGALAEAELRRHSDDFVAAARAAGAPTVYEPKLGIHDWPYWREMFASSLKWGYFGEVPDAPAAWTYTTAAQQGRAWDVSFAFDRPPEGVVRFSRDGAILRASGAGRATVQVDGQAAFVAELPFERTAPVNPARSSSTAAALDRVFDVRRLLRTQIARARRVKAPAVRVPARLRAPFSRLYPNGSASRRRYVLHLGAARGCRGATACSVASFLADRRGKRDGGARAVRLAKGFRGYFTPSRCGASCSAPQVQWRQGGVLYTIYSKVGEGSSDRERVVALANAAITGR